MSQNGHSSHGTRLMPAGGRLLGHNNARSNAANNSNSANMNHTSSSQAAAASWSHSAVGSNQNVASSSSHQQRASPGTPSAADYENKVTAPPSPPSSSCSQSGTSLKEHDLLGLSEVSSSSAAKQDNSAKNSNFQSEELNLNLNLGATELRLGPQDARKVLDSGFQHQRSGAAARMSELSSAPGSESFLCGLEGGGKGTDQGSLAAADRRSSNADQYALNPEHPQQVLDRGFGYNSRSGERVPSTQVGRGDVVEGTACRPLIESESLQKWHGGGADRKVSNESLRLGMSPLQSKRGLNNQEDLSEKNLFLMSDRNYQDKTPEAKQQEQQRLASEDHHHALVFQERAWQERSNQHNVGQEDVSSAERFERQMPDRGVGLDHHQGVGGKPEQTERLKHEAFLVEKRNLSEGNNALATLQQQQQPEPRFVADLSATEQSPRHADYGPQKLWQSQGSRSTEVCRQQVATPDFQTQQQQQMSNSVQQGESSCRNGFPGPLGGGGFPGSRVVFVPSKAGVSGAKRPFDTIGTVSDARNFGDGRSGQACPVAANSSVIVSNNTSSSDADAKSKAQPPLYQPWSAKATPSWQMLQHSGGSFGPFPSQAPGRSPAMPTMNNSGAEAAGVGGDPGQKAWESHSKSFQPEPAASSVGQKMNSGPSSENKPSTAQVSTPATDASSAPRAAPPATQAVGWPPLRSFRKSTIAAQPRPSPIETQPRPPPQPPQAASPASVASQPQPNTCFVKVYMDGMPIGRKVDLKVYSSYEKLSLVLEDMFRGFVNGQKSVQGGRDMAPLPSDKRSFLHGSDYVLTYEDQEGDLMLVGDVPWTMFMDTVKRLRIMKGSEAIGLAEKGTKAQPTV